MDGYATADVTYPKRCVRLAFVTKGQGMDPSGTTTTYPYGTLFENSKLDGLHFDEKLLDEGGGEEKCGRKVARFLLLCCCCPCLGFISCIDF